MIVITLPSGQQLGITFTYTDVDARYRGPRAKCGHPSKVLVEKMDRLTVPPKTRQTKCEILDVGPKGTELKVLASESVRLFYGDNPSRVVARKLALKRTLDKWGALNKKDRAALYEQLFKKVNMVAPSRRHPVKAEATA